jgi:hypothetical protein
MNDADFLNGIDAIEEDIENNLSVICKTTFPCTGALEFLLSLRYLKANPPTCWSYLNLTQGDAIQSLLKGETLTINTTGTIIEYKISNKNSIF